MIKNNIHKTVYKFSVKQKLVLLMTNRNKSYALSLLEHFINYMTMGNFLKMSLYEQKRLYHENNFNLIFNSEYQFLKYIQEMTNKKQKRKLEQEIKTFIAPNDNAGLTFFFCQNISEKTIKEIIKEIAINKEINNIYFLPSMFIIKLEHKIKINWNRLFIKCKKIDYHYKDFYVKYYDYFRTKLSTLYNEEMEKIKWTENRK